MPYRVIGLTMLLICVGATGAWAQPRAYVVNKETNQVAVIDASTNTVLPNRIAVGGDRKTIVATGSRAYVVCRDDAAGDGSVWVIDTNSNQVIKTITVGNQPAAVALDAGYLYVANEGSRVQQNSSVSVIDISTNAVVKTIPVGIWPECIAARDNQVYVANLRGNSVSVIDTNDFTVTNVTVGKLPGALAVTEKWVYVVNRDDNQGVSVIDRSTLAVKNIAVDGHLSNMAVTSRWVYVVVKPENSVCVIDRKTNTVLPDKIKVESAPIGIAAPPGTGRVYVANFGSDSVSVIDTGNNTVIKTLKVGSSPDHVRLGVGRVYVTNDGGSISVIDTLSDSVQTISNVGPNRKDVAVSSSPLYITGDGNSLAVVDTITNATTATVQVGSVPRAIAVNDNRVFVANRKDASVSVIDRVTNTLVDTIDLKGVHPEAMAIYRGRLWAVGLSQDFDAMMAVFDIHSPHRSHWIQKWGKGLTLQGVGGVNDAVYVSGRQAGVLVFDWKSTQYMKLIPVGPDPFRVGVGSNKVYVASMGNPSSEGPSVSVIDAKTDTESKRIPLTKQVWPVALWVDTSSVYVANYWSKSVSVIDRASNTVVNTLTLNSTPTTVAVVGNHLYVTVDDHDILKNGSVHVFNTSTYEKVNQFTLDIDPGTMTAYTRTVPAVSK